MAKLPPPTSSLTTNYTIGVDPGCPLHMAMLSPTGKWIAHAGGEVLSSKIDGKWINKPEKVSALLKKWVAYAGGPEKIEVMIESVTIRPGENLVSGAKFVGSMYMAWTAAALLGMKVHHAHPRSWKVALSLTSSKKKSLSRAYWLFPERKERLKLESDHNYAEAALLAYYLRESLLKQKIDAVTKA